MSVKVPVSVPVFVIVTDPSTVCPTLTPWAVRTAPVPERCSASVPVVIALPGIVSGVAVKFA